MLPGAALSLKQCVSIGNGCSSTDDENDACGSFKTDGVPGTFQTTLKATMEHGISALCTCIFTQHGYSCLLLLYFTSHFCSY